MNETRPDYLSLENLHSCLIEEASEVAKFMAKARRFGLEDYPPDIPNAETNRMKMASEIGDLLGILQMIQREYCPDDARHVEITAMRKERKVRENYGRRFAP